MATHDPNPNKRQFEWVPSPEIVAGSNLTAFLKQVGLPDHASLLARSEADPAWLMQQVFDFCDVRFHTPFERMLDTTDGIEWARWCIGGTTNIVLNCLDRHRGTPTWERSFLVWEGEDAAEQRSLTYAEFDREVCRLAGALRSLGVGRGDVVALYLPNLPETYIAFFAVLKIGAILMPLFSGFGPVPLATRLLDGDARVVLTADGTWRRGQPAPMKAVLDEALVDVPGVRAVVVLRRIGAALDTPMQTGRDHDWRALTAAMPTGLDTEPMPAEAARSCSTPRGRPAGRRAACGRTSASSARWSRATSTSAATSNRPTAISS